MSKQEVQVTVAIAKSPAEVIGFVSDVQNRAKYIPSLRAISDVQGEPGTTEQSWNWKWSLLKQDFEGTGRCVECVPGERYTFVTEGGIASKFTYQAKPDGDGANLTITVEFEVPAILAGHEGLEQLLASAKQRGQESVQNLKAMLEQ